MKTRHGTKLAALLLAAALATAIGGALSQQAPPTQSKGIALKPLATVDLGPEIPGMEKRQMRMRLVTMEPGAVFGFHGHQDRPGMVYVISGKLIEHRAGVSREYGAGESWPETRETEHWAENRESVPAVLVVVDIFRQP